MSQRLLDQAVDIAMATNANHRHTVGKVRRHIQAIHANGAGGTYQRDAAADRRLFR
jgi:hypothetical protein